MMHYPPFAAMANVGACRKERSGHAHEFRAWFPADARTGKLRILGPASTGAPPENEYRYHS
jgi:hypothetical protein